MQASASHNTASTRTRLRPRWNGSSGAPATSVAKPPRRTMQRAQHKTDHRQRGEDQRQCGDLAQHARAETLQPLVDQRGQHGVAAGNAEHRRDAEIADRGDEGERRAGEDRRRRERHDHGMRDAQRTRAAQAGGLDQVARQVAQPRAHREEDERRALDAHHQHDAPLRIERIGRARGGRQAQRTEDRAARAGQFDPGQRGDLRGDQERQQGDEGERGLGAHVGEREHERRRRADHDRHERRQQARFERIDQRALRRRAAPLSEQEAKDFAVGSRRQRFHEQSGERPEPENGDVAGQHRQQRGFAGEQRTRRQRHGRGTRHCHTPLITRERG